jgi:pimeloyl-ACP methyl ester carboxylesterase
MSTPIPAAPSKKKSTSVRIPRGLRPAMRVLSAVAPPLASRLAVRLFRTPPRHVSSEIESRILTGARSATLTVAHTPAPIPVWIWGEGPPVLLVHGWGSRGARLGSFVAPLVQAGHSVVAFDAPGHGAARERQSSLPQFLFAIEAVAREHGPFAGIVAHSMGGAATTLSMARGVRTERVVFLAPAADPAGYVRYFAALLGLPDNVRRGMERRIVHRFRMDWPEFDVPAAAKELTTPLLVIHDALDAEVPLSNGEALARAWPGAVLVTTNGLGHKRIVHDEEVVARAVEFLLAREKRSASCSLCPS